MDTVKRLSCDGSLVTVTEDEDGTPLDVGRKQRTVSAPLKRALWARDRGCSFPGCDHKHYVDAHHVQHWADGGATSLENLALLCAHHHRLLHEGGFRMRRDGEGRWYFQRADGRAIPQFGYRLADLRDDFEPSAEVREVRGVYRVDRPLLASSHPVRDRRLALIGQVRVRPTFYSATRTPIHPARGGPVPRKRGSSNPAPSTPPASPSTPNVE